MRVRAPRLVQQRLGCEVLRRLVQFLARELVIEQPADLETLTARYARFAGDFITEAAQGDAPFFFYMAFNVAFIVQYFSCLFDIGWNS